jgi:hypothetical protein
MVRFANFFHTFADTFPLSEYLSTLFVLVVASFALWSGVARERRSTVLVWLATVGMSAS